MPNFESRLHIPSRPGHTKATRHLDPAASYQLEAHGQPIQAVASVRERGHGLERASYLASLTLPVALLGGRLQRTLH